MADLFSRAAAHCYKECRFVVTTRPAAYIGDARLSTEFAVERIAPLKPEAIESFLNAWSACLYPENAAQAKSHAQELLTQVNARPEIRDSMATTPVMLTALAAIHYNERRLPDDRADLYKSILYWLAGSRERKPGRRRDKECIKLLALLAFGMQTHAGGRIAQAERSLAADLLESKIPDRDKASEFLEEEELDSGILVSCGAKVEFLHLTFQEYLAATHLEGLREQDQAATVLQARHRYTPEWREFLCLFGASLSEPRAQGLFSLLLENGGWTLFDRSKTLALIVAMLQDKKGLEIDDERYLDFARDMIHLFDSGPETHDIDGWTRGNAALAWEQLNDCSRRRRPSDPNYWITIGPLQIGQFPVTVWEYEFFVDAVGHRPDRWRDQLAYKNRPVVNLSWHDAVSYCEWQKCRLPTVEEWYLAAAGSEKREYPWGDHEPDGVRANFNMDIGHPTPVGLFPAGQTPDGALDMAGNVWEWTSSADKDDWKYLRGGAFVNYPRNLRAANRYNYPPDFGDFDFGFRCVREVPVP